MSRAKPTRFVGVRLPVEVVDRVDESARANHRSRTGEIAHQLGERMAVTWSPHQQAAHRARHAAQQPRPDPVVADRAARLGAANAKRKAKA